MYARAVGNMHASRGCFRGAINVSTTTYRGFCSAFPPQFEVTGSLTSHSDTHGLRFGIVLTVAFDEVMGDMRSFKEMLYVITCSMRILPFFRTPGYYNGSWVLDGGCRARGGGLARQGAPLLQDGAQLPLGQGLQLVWVGQGLPGARVVACARMCSRGHVYLRVLVCGSSS